MVNYGTFRARNPVTSAQYGLAAYSLWLRNGDHYRWLTAIHVADWLVRTQHRNGEWEYSFPEPVPGSTETLAKGWGSALAQGQAISLLERVYRRTHRCYLTGVERAHNAPDPGHQGRPRPSFDHGIYFEEYPTRACQLLAQRRPSDADRRLRRRRPWSRQPRRPVHTSRGHGRRQPCPNSTHTPGTATTRSRLGRHALPGYNATMRF